MAMLITQGLTSLSAVSLGAGRVLLAACTQQLARYSVGVGSKQQQADTQPKPSRRTAASAAAANAPSTLPEVPKAKTAGDRPARLLCLNSINDPDNWGLGESPQGSGEPAYYWLGSSISNPKEHVSPASPRAGAPNLRPGQGFRTAQTRPMVQRIVFRSSMIDPEHGFSFRSSMMDPPLPPLQGRAVAKASSAEQEER